MSGSSVQLGITMNIRINDVPAKLKESLYISLKIGLCGALRFISLLNTGFWRLTVSNFFTVQYEGCQAFQESNSLSGWKREIRHRVQHRVALLSLRADGAAEWGIFLTRMSLLKWVSALPRERHGWGGQVSPHNDIKVSDDKKRQFRPGTRYE